MKRCDHKNENIAVKSSLFMDHVSEDTPKKQNEVEGGG